MLRSVKEMIGIPVHADNEKVGNIRDILFDEGDWNLRHFDIEKGKGFHFDIHYLYGIMDEGIDQKRYLLKPAQLELPGPDAASDEATLRMSEEALDECTSFAEDMPAEYQFEDEFARYLKRTAYDRRPEIPPPSRISEYVPPTTAYDHSEEELREHRNRIREIAETRLHSAHAIIGYEVHGIEGSLGALSDLLLDDATWEIRHLVVDSEDESLAQGSLLDPSDVRALNWSASAVEVELNEAQLKERPPYTEDVLADRGKGK